MELYECLFTSLCFTEISLHSTLSLSILVSYVVDIIHIHFECLYASVNIMKMRTMLYMHAVKAEMCVIV